MQILFWISIGLWLVALVAYALMLSGHVQRRDVLYRASVACAVGAMITGGLYMLYGM